MTLLWIVFIGALLLLYLLTGTGETTESEDFHVEFRSSDPDDGRSDIIAVYPKGEAPVFTLKDTGESFKTFSEAVKHTGYLKESK